MTAREFDERVQITTATGTEELIYQAPDGEVAIIQKVSAVNTDTSTNGLVNLWFANNGAASVAPGDESHFIVDESLAAKEIKVLKTAARRVPPGGKIYADVQKADGTDFQSAVNITISGVLVSQNLPATGTSGA